MSYLHGPSICVEGSYYAQKFYYPFTQLWAHCLSLASSPGDSSKTIISIYSPVILANDLLNWLATSINATGYQQYMFTVELYCVWRSCTHQLLVHAIPLPEYIWWVTKPSKILCHLLRLLSEIICVVFPNWNISRACILVLALRKEN